MRAAKENKPRIRIMVVDDHPVVRVGLSAIIDSQADMTVVAETGSGEEAITLFGKHKPDVTVMDLRLEQMNGAKCIRTIRTGYPDARFLVLTTYRGDEDIYKAIEAGASGYLIKGMQRQELLDALRCVFRGERYLPPQIQRVLDTRSSQPSLSVREREVLSLMAAGKSNKEIASALNIAEITVKCHLTAIFEYLKVTNRTEALGAAMQRGLVKF